MEFVTYKNIECKNALHKHSSKWLPFKYDLNLYRGCEHGCVYCYAIYSHKYLEDEKFFSNIYIKTNILDELEKKLSSKKWNKDVINLGGVCDSYQPAENIYQYMPDILRIFIKYKNPVIISTKSALILRDYDLLIKLSEVASVNVACTITTVEQKNADLIEPFASDVASRFKILEAFAGTKIKTGLHIMPIIPYITDSKFNISVLYKKAYDYNVNYVYTCLLNLRGSVRTNFFKFVKNCYPNKYIQIKCLFDNSALRKEYKYNLYKLVKKISSFYGYSNDK